MSGIDGAGKSTQIKFLANWLERDGSRVKVIWARPGSTPRLLAAKYIIRKFTRSVPAPGHSKKRDDLLKSSNVGVIWGWLSFIDVLIEYALVSRFSTIKYDYVIFDRFIDDLYIDLNIHLGKNLINQRIRSFISAILPACKRNFFFKIPLVVSKSRCLEKYEPFPDREFEKVTRFDMYDSFNSNINYTQIDGTLDVKVVEQIVRQELGL